MKKFKFTHQLEGNRIFLKKHSVELAQTMFEYVNKDRERLDRFMPWTEFVKTVEDEERFILDTHKSWEDMTLFDYGIFQKENNIYLGNIGVHTIMWEHDWCELGYWILGEFEGNGFVTEAVKILEKYIFEQGFNRLLIRCSSLNEKSSKIPERLNYNLEGLFKQDSIEKGAYRDTKAFAKLSSDYIRETKNLFIRRARYLDAAGIITTHIKSIREVCSKDYNQKQIKAWSGLDFKKEIWCKTIDTDHVWVVDDGNGILGFGHLKFYDKNKAEIMGLYFAPSIIGKGFGKKMIATMKGFAQLRGCNKLTLSSTITARDFYLRQGFILQGDVKNIVIGGESVECYRMESVI